MAMALTHHAKRLLLWTLSGAVLGTIAASLIAPSFLISQNTTRFPEAQCNCIQVTRDTADSLIRWQLVGAAIGAGLLLIVGILLRLRRQARASPPESAS
jgi:hypothetical protein